MATSGKRPYGGLEDLKGIRRARPARAHRVAVGTGRRLPSDLSLGKRKRMQNRRVAVATR
jgi:hypothetical protein